MLFRRAGHIRWCFYFEWVWHHLRFSGVYFAMYLRACVCNSWRAMVVLEQTWVYMWEGLPCLPWIVDWCRKWRPFTFPMVVMHRDKTSNPWQQRWLPEYWVISHKVFPVELIPCLSHIIRAMSQLRNECSHFNESWWKGGIILLRNCLGKWKRQCSTVRLLYNLLFHHLTCPISAETTCWSSLLGF